jgi:DNA primase
MPVLRTDDYAKEEIRSRADIASVIGRYVNLKASGQTLKGLCPFHKEKTPSFHVNPSRGFFHCFGCGKGGDVFAFLQEIENISFFDALTMLANETGVKIHKEENTGQEVKQSHNEISRTEMLRIHEIAALFFYNNVKKTPKAIEYFKSRGLKAETVKEFRLGYSQQQWSALVDYFKEQNVSLQTLVKCGLAIEKDDGKSYDRFRDRVMFPLCDLSGKTIAFAGRGLNDDVQPKYLNSPETLLYKKKDFLYGLNKSRQYIKDQGFALVMEGYMDYLTLYQAGIRNAVASSGTAFTPEHGHLLQRFTSKIVLVFDGDNAGQTAAQRAIFVLAPLGLDISILVLPGDEDPDSFVKQYGPQAFLDLIKDASEWDSFIIDKAISENKATTPIGKSAVIQYLNPLVQSISNPIALQKFKKEISERLGLNEKLVYQTLGKNYSNAKSVQKSSNEDESYSNSIEGAFLRILMTCPEMINEAVKYIIPQTLTDGISGDIYSLLLNAYSEKCCIDDICDRTNDPEIKRIISLLLVKPALKEHIQEEFVQKVVHLRAKYLRNRLREVKIQLKKEPTRKLELLQQIKDYSIQLKELDIRE